MTLDHREFVSAIDPKTRSDLTELSDGPALTRLAVLICLIAGLSALILAKTPLRWCAVPILGVLLAFLFTLQHECTHKTPFRSPLLNELLGHMTGFVIVQPFLWFRYFHLAHHKYTNLKGLDPELDGEPKPETILAFVWHLSCVGYWRDKASALIRSAKGQVNADYVPERVAGRLATEARTMSALYLLVALGIVLMPHLFWIWPGPLLFGFPLLRLYLLAEHGRCPEVANMFDNTRTTLTNRAVRLIAWNMPYHTEHHVYPSVPFHKLPDLHALSETHLRQVENGYRRFSVGYVRGLDRVEDGSL